MLLDDDVGDGQLGQLGQQRTCAVELVGAVDDELDLLAADLRLEIVGIAARDRPALVDDDDVVGEQQGRLGDQRAGEVEPPAHATRVGLHRPVGGVGELS